MLARVIQLSSSSSCLNAPIFFHSSCEVHLVEGIFCYRFRCYSSERLGCKNLSSNLSRHHWVQTLYWAQTSRVLSAPLIALICNWIIWMPILGRNCLTLYSLRFSVRVMSICRVFKCIYIVFAPCFLERFWQHDNAMRPSSLGYIMVRVYRSFDSRLA